MKKALCFTLALAAAAAVSAQGMKMPMEGGKSMNGMSMDGGKAAPTASAPKSSMPLVDGVVQKIDPAKGLIVLKHGDLPNLAMPAMTMGFDIADKKMLKAVKAGDKVKFQAEMVGGKATVTELKKVR